MHDLYEQRDQFYIEPNATVRGGLTLGLVLGALTFGAGMYFAEPTRVWGAFLFNTFFFFAIGLGGIAFGAMQDVIGAVWGRPIKRLHETLSAFVPVAAAMMAFFLVCIGFDIGGAGSVYSWVADPSIVEHFHGKDVWLQKNFMIVRDLFALAVTVALWRWQFGLGTQRDMAFVKGNRDEAIRLGVAARDKLRYWSAPVLVVYSLTFTLLAFDLLMSLSPLWFSTLWGGWLFAVMMQTLMATILIFMFALRDTPLGQIFKRQQFHDVGKLMHGFTIFFAYLTYAHILTYWYGNVPEETEYFLHRMHQPWLGIIIAAPLLSFVVPLFALIFKAAKWTAPVTMTLAGLILVSQWMTYIIIVQPEVTKHGLSGGPWVEIGVGFGVLSLFLGSFFKTAKSQPVLGVADPLLAESMSGHH